MFVHISAVEKAGLSNLNEGTKVSYDVVADRGKKSAETFGSAVSCIETVPPARPGMGPFLMSRGQPQA